MVIGPHALDLLGTPILDSKWFEIVKSISDRYIELYENITGEKFQSEEDSATGSEILERMSARIGKCLEGLE